MLDGALVGGPNQKDNFEDSRKNVKQSEVALDYNAGLQVGFRWLTTGNYAATRGGVLEDVLGLEDILEDTF